MTDGLTLLPWQDELALVPREYDVAMLAARGGGKSFAFAALVVKDVQEYGSKYRGLFVRRDHAGGLDFVATALDIFTRVFGVRGVRFNTQSGVCKFSNGATLEINQLADLSDAAKFQGRSITSLMVDEVQQWPDPAPLDRLRANLRGPADVPVRVVIAGNPGGVGHHWLLQRYFKAGPWEPFVDAASGRTWLRVPSSFRDNVHIDRDGYERQLIAACVSDVGLLKSWRDGDWFACLSGSFFASVIDDSRNATPSWPAIPTYYGERWQTYLAHDFGSSAPSVTYVVARSPGAVGPDDRFYPRDSLVLVDELATNEPGNLNRGMGYVVPALAEQIVEMCVRWKVKPRGCADDAIFARTGSGAGSIAEEFQRAGVSFYPAKKADRLTGWTKMRRLLADAGKVDMAGLYIARHCEYFWQTVPYLARDPRRPEEVDSRGPDHAADCVRYGCLHQRRIAVMTPMY